MSTRPLQPSCDHGVQNFTVVWLDASIDEVNDNDFFNTISKLREVVNDVNTFATVDECVNFISNIENEQIFLIVSDAFGQTVVPTVHVMAQVSHIYIFTENEFRHKQWVKQWPKVKGVFADLKPICNALKQAALDCDQNTILMSFIAPSATTASPNLDQLDKSYMYTQTLKEIILTIDCQQQQFDEFISYCRMHFAGNTKELTNIDKFEQEYLKHEPIWWYTYPCFLYPMLNRALRTIDVDLIVQTGFFVRDLHEHILTLYRDQYSGRKRSDSFVVYRGQGLSQLDFDQLVKVKGGLLSFNNFLSTSKNRQTSLDFARDTAKTSDLGILFVLNIDPSIPSTPFANVHAVSCYQDEDEVLFSMHSVFRIGNIKKLDGNYRLWQVDLAIAGDKDPQLEALTEQIRQETFPQMKGWYRLGQLLIQVSQFDKAQQAYEILLEQTTNDGDAAFINHQLGFVQDSLGKYEEALSFYQKSIEMYETRVDNDHALANSHGSIGVVYEKMGDYSKALASHEKALEIYQKTLPSNHSHLATSYDDIGKVYSQMGEYLKALASHEKALDIYEKTLPPNHPHLATSYTCHGSAYERMGDYSQALLCYEQALDIYEKTLPPNHPSLAASYNNIGGVYDAIGEYSKALSAHEKALEIYQKTLPPFHPHLAASYACHGSVHERMGDYPKALLSLEKALEIYQKTFPANHPHLATSYDDIGKVYSQMGDYPKALLSHEKALEIYQKTLPPNHPHLATSYACHGSVYEKMGEYEKALASYEKSLDIYHKTLPPNHPNLATSYACHGAVYYQMNEFAKALPFFERAVEIGQHSLPPNHPHLQLYESYLEIIKKDL